MSLAASIGMLARVNSGGGATHGLAYPPATKYHIPHGLSIALIMPYVMAFNVNSSISKFIRIAEAMGEKTKGLPDKEAANKAIGAISSLLKDCGISLGLKEFGVKESDLGKFADEVYKYSYRHIERNPILLTREDIINIYKSAF